MNHNRWSQQQKHRGSAHYSQQNAQPSHPEIQHTYIPNVLDRQADALYSDVHRSLTRAVDASHSMPTSEHVLYNSYESYRNFTLEEQRELNAMMSQLTECYQMPQYYPQGAPLAAVDQFDRVNFGAIEDMQDKYDAVHEFSEQMYDRVGQNLDDASGLRLRDAQLIQATIDAANQNRMIATTSRLMTPNQPMYNKQQNQHLSLQTNLSSSSSSSSLTRPSETNSPSSFVSNQQQHIGGVDQQISSRFQPPGSYRFNEKRPAIQKNQHGGFMGKQQSPYYQRFSMKENKNIPRPQDSFIDEVDNSSEPFKPLIKEKPNALVPFSLNLELDEHDNEYYPHPYEYEIRHFDVAQETLRYRDPIEPIDFNSTPVVLVETIEQLEEMCQTIKQEKEIAVDVEHHSYRSYQGITCLLQISTRTQDFVIDTIKLRSELYRLNESFTNPDIVKVFHGADCDTLWLQRDFGVYVVNLFDTSRAAKLMKFAHLSLAFLMKHYCNVELDKSYQLADWRERPLPLPMLQYARADTHFLLYIYDRLSIDLLRRDKTNEHVGMNLLRSVFNRCKDICLKRYEKPPPYSDKSFFSVLRRSRTTFNAKQMYAFKEMYIWRDKISRKLDESVGYVLPNNLMIRIAEYLPGEPQGITALCNPVPPTLKKYLNDVHAIILKANSIPLEPSKVMSGSGDTVSIDPNLKSIDLDSINHKQDTAHAAGLQEGEVLGISDKLYQLNCEDPSYAGARRVDNGHLPGGQQYANQQNQLDCTKYVNNFNQNRSRLYNFLDSPSNEKNQAGMRKVHQLIQKQFVPPYRRYEARNK